MRFLWQKTSKIYLNDWKTRQGIQITNFELIDRSIDVPSLRDLIELKKFLSIRNGLADLLYFLKNENFCSMSVILELAILNDEWALVLKLTESADIQFCYIGAKTKYHLHEVIFSRILDLLKQGKFPPEEFYKLVHLRIKKEYIGVSLFERLKQIIVEEMKDCQTKNAISLSSPLLENFLDFVYFLETNNLLVDDFLNRLVKSSIKYRNLPVLQSLKEYFPDEFPWLVLASLKFDFISKVQENFPQVFIKQNYLKYIIKCYFDSPIAEEAEVYRLLSWLKDKNLDEFRLDNSLLPYILGAPYHFHSKVIFINFLINLKVISKNKFVMENLKHLHQIHPLVFEVLISADDLKNLSLNITGCKSNKKQTMIEPLLCALSEEENQNQILFMYLAVNRLNINRDLVFNNLNLVPNLKGLNSTAIQQLLFILSFYNDERRLKLLLNLLPGDDRSIQNSYEVLSILKNSECLGIKIPKNPKNISLLSQELLPIKKLIQTANINLGLANYADNLEQLKFKHLSISVPRTADDLRKVGILFKNCLSQDRHSRYVSDIILRNIIVFYLEKEDERYCISINPYSRKVIEAKKLGQEMMPAPMVSSLEFFLREIDFGIKWL